MSERRDLEGYIFLIVCTVGQSISSNATLTMLKRPFACAERDRLFIISVYITNKVSVTSFLYYTGYIESNSSPVASWWWDMVSRDFTWNRFSLSLGLSQGQRHVEQTLTSLRLRRFCDYLSSRCSQSLSASFFS